MRLHRAGDGQQRTKDGGLPKVETRLFLTSIPSGQLSPERMLTLTSALGD
ncbi:hypothetical protein KYC5002_30610 [Archangium violaceum]|nr:hypothetical protein KYC5002_30610 [Archangium gephyra]